MAGRVGKSVSWRIVSMSLLSSKSFDSFLVSALFKHSLRIFVYLTVFPIKILRKRAVDQTFTERKLEAGRCNDWIWSCQAKYLLSTLRYGGVHGVVAL